MKYTMVVYPTGYGVLPYQGGFLDQPHRMISFWQIFMNAERIVSTRGIS